MPKSRILIIDRDHALVPILKLSSDGEITHPFELARDGDEASYFLGQFDDIGLIISSWSLSHAEQEKIILKNGQGKNLPFIMLSKESQATVARKMPYFFSNAKNSIIEYSKMQTDFASKVRYALEDYTKKGEFQIISFPLLLRFGSLGFEIFHRIQSEKRFIALNQKFDNIDIPKVLSFRSEGHHLYMKVNDYQLYLDKVVKAMLLEDGDSFEKAPLTSAVLLEKYKAFGFSEESFRNGQMLLNRFLSSLRSHKKILKHLGWMKKVHDYRHLSSTLTLSLVLDLGKKLGQSSDKFDEKMAYATLLKDISLKEDYISLITKEEVLYLDIEEGEKEAILKHPHESARMLSNISLIPSDTLKIIEQHHEMPDGSGYPRGLTYTHIHAASCVYIICYHVAHEMLKNIKLDNEELIQKIKTYLELYFSLPKFDKYKVALLSLLEK